MSRASRPSSAGRPVVITGAASGIGRALARRLSAARLAGGDRRRRRGRAEGDRGRRCPGRCSPGSSTSATPATVPSFADRGTRLAPRAAGGGVQQRRRRGRLDRARRRPGGRRLAAATSTSTASSTARGRSCRSWSSRTQGVIVNTSSVFGLLGMPYQSAYCACEVRRPRLHRRAAAGAARHRRAGGDRPPGRHHDQHRPQRAGSARTPKVAAAPRTRSRREFEAVTMTSPDKAAEIIHRGVERGKARILVGPDAYLFDALARLAPTRYYDVIECPAEAAGGAMSRPRRRADRRRRAVRHRRRAPPADGVPATDVRHPGGPRRDRRHLGPVPLPRRPVRLGHVHPRLPVPAVDRARRPSPTAPSILRLHPRHRAPRRASTGTSGSATASSAPPGPARTPAGRSRPTHDGEPSGSPAGFLYVCSGYYRYDAGLHAGTSRASSGFGGQVVHPQHWPEDLDYAGKRVVVIGSGATAVTLVPALAEHGRARDDAAALADATSCRCPARTPSPNRLRAAARRAPRRTRSRGGRTSRSSTLSTSSAGAARDLVQRADPRARRAGSCRTGYDVDTHFKPALRPVGPAAVPRARTATCSAPSARGRASVVTDRIDTFTETGIRLESGAELDGGHRRHRDRAATCWRFGGIELRRRRPRRSSCRRRWPTRA